MLYDGILVNNGVYEVYVSIQDGTEHCGNFLSENEAIAAYKNGQEIFNHNSNKTPSFYKEETVISYKVVKIK